MRFNIKRFNNLKKGIIFVLIAVSNVFIFVSSSINAQSYSLYDSYETNTLDTTKWVERDTGNYLDQYGGSLRIKKSKLATSSNPQAYVANDPAIYAKNSVSRVGGRAFVNLMRTTVHTSKGPVAHFSTTQFPESPLSNGYGITTDTNGGKLPLTRFNAVVPGGTAAYRLADGTSGYDPYTVKGIDYVTATVLRPDNGSFHIVSGGNFGTYPNATLIWANSKGNDTTVYPGINNVGGQALIQETKVVDLGGDFATQFGLAKVADTFTRTSNLADTIPDKKATENNEVQPPTLNKWKVLSGSFNTDGDKVIPSKYGQAIVESVSDGIFEVDITTPESGNYIAGLVFRAKDANNYLYFAAYGNEFRLASVQNGMYVGIGATGAYTFGNGVTRKLRVITHGPKICVYVDESEPIGECFETTFNINEKGVGIGQFPYLSSAGEPGISKFDNFAVWPKTVTLPENLIDKPTLPNSGENIVLKDTFNEPNINLNNHLPEIRPESNNGWEIVNGEWAIVDNEATILAKGSEQNYRNVTAVVTETGLNDLTVSADLFLAKAPAPGITEWFSGLILRYKDRDNFTYARFLWQNGSPEIELWDTVNGVTNPDLFSSEGGFINATNISNILSENTRHNLKVSLIGNQFAAYMDNQLIVQGTTDNMSNGTKAGLIINTDNDNLGSPFPDDDIVTSPFVKYDNFEVRNSLSDITAPPIVNDVNTNSILTNIAPVLEWTNVIDDASGTSFYRVYRSTQENILGDRINADSQTSAPDFIDSDLNTSGTYFYTVRAVDRAGNENTSDYNKQLEIKFDTHAPTGSLIINTNSEGTNNPAVNLNIAAEDNFSSSSNIQMQISEREDFSNTSWIPYNQSIIFNLSGDGIKTLFVRFKDEPGNISSTYSDSILLDTVVPNGSLVLDENREFTNSYVSRARITASESPNNIKIQLSNSPEFGDFWDEYNNLIYWNLEKFDGEKTVYYRIKDRGGNISQVYSDTVNLDLSAPYKSKVIINKSSEITKSRSVTLSLEAYDDYAGLADVMISENPNFTGASFQPMAPIISYNISSFGSGTKTIYVVFRDKAGNLSEVASDTIYYYGR